MVFASKMFEKHLWKSDILSKDSASKNQLPDLSVNGTLVENELKFRNEKSCKDYFPCPRPST